MTKRTVIQKAWEVANGRSNYTVATVYRAGRGWDIDYGQNESDIYHPRDKDGNQLFATIGRIWDYENYRATKAEVTEWLFGIDSPLS